MVGTGDFCKIANFDFTLLDDSITGHIFVSDRRGKWAAEIDLDVARKMVAGKVARVMSPGTIQKLYSSKEFKTLIKERDNYICYYCGRKGNTIDHMIPKSLGGISTFSNCVCACYRCNVRKGSKLVVGNQQPHSMEKRPS